MLELKLDTIKTREQLKLAEQASTTATIRATNRIARRVAAHAELITPKSSGYLSARIVVVDAKWESETGSATAQVVAATSYSSYVELGFMAHFVPFHIAPGLYWEAIHRWGWRVPSPGAVKNPRAGWQYLIPLGRKSPVGGVKVSGRAQPFLRPALREVLDRHEYLAILSEEFELEYERLRRAL